jgi:hypothetical protein
MTGIWDGAEALFLLCARYAALEAPLFHGCAGGFALLHGNPKSKVKGSGQECPLHTSIAPHERGF